jgi:hypothetical protein
MMEKTEKAKILSQIVNGSWIEMNYEITTNAANLSPLQASIHVVMFI